MNKYLLLIIISLLLLFSCDKYRDGPKISFRTKSTRLCQKWELIRVENQNGIIDDYNAEIQFNKDGSYSKYYWDLDDSLHILNGQWTWENEKEWISIDLSAWNLNYPYNIPTTPFSTPGADGIRTFEIHLLKYQELLIEDLKTEALFYFVRIPTE